ncbi:UNVERIFIED_ORG: hypothetical protein BTE55_16735 [Rhizobium sophorae]
MGLQPASVIWPLQLQFEAYNSWPENGIFGVAGFTDGTQDIKFNHRIAPQGYYFMSLIFRFCNEDTLPWLYESAI